MATNWVYIAAITAIPLVYLLNLTIKVLNWMWKLKNIGAAVNNFAVEPKPHWLYGHLNLITAIDEALIKTHFEWVKKTDKGAYALNLGLCSQLVLCHPDTVKILLKTAEPKGFIPATGSSYRWLVPWLGDGLLTSSGAKWFRNRRLLTPGFHFNILKPYMKINNQCAERLVNSFKESSTNGESVEVFRLVSLCTLNIIRKCAFSSKEDLQVEGLDSQYLQGVTELSTLMMKRLLSPILLFNSVYKLTKSGRRFFRLTELSHCVADDIIKERKRDLQSEMSTKDRCVDFLDILLLAKDEEGNGLTDLEIRDEVESFMFAGHDTTASAISWILYNLARHPDIQQRAYEEVKAVFENKSMRQLEWSDLEHIPYLTRCIKESMRLHPPVPFYDRELTKPLEIKGHTLLPGTIVGINTYGLHHNPAVWGEDHMVFNPDRFLPDNIASMDSFAFIPFSAGPRNCIGQHFAMNEIKTTVAHVLFQFELSVDNSHPVEMMPLLVLRAKYGLNLYFKNRD